MFLGVDQSATGTGVCFMAPRRMAYETFVIKGVTVAKLRGGARLKYIYDCIHEFLRRKTNGNFGIIKLAAMEGYAYGLGQKRVEGGGTIQAYGNPFQLGEIGGVIKLLFENLGIPYIVVNPMDLKRYVKGTPGGPKDVIMAYLTHEFKIRFEENNAADAFALALIAMHYESEWFERAPDAKTREAREKVINEIRIDPQAILRKAAKDRIRREQLDELGVEPVIEKVRFKPKKVI